MIAVRPTISRETLTRIADAANRAPSAENLQPWQFQADEESIDFCMDLPRQLDSDLDRMLGVTAIGTSLENAILVASKQRLDAKIEFLAETVRPRAVQAFAPIVRLSFNGECEPNPLANRVYERVTARRMDPALAVARAALDEFENSIDTFADVRLHWVDPDCLSEFAALVGSGNRMRLEHKAYHAELYRSLRFRRADVERTNDGLDMSAMQLQFGASTIMRPLQYWPLMRIANALGFSRLVGRQAKQEVCRSGAVGFLTIPRAELPDFVVGARALERLWLTATRLGLCFHPTASLPVFLTHARLGCPHMSTWHQETVAHIQEVFFGIFAEMAGRVVQMAFRIGYGPIPPVRTRRRPLEDVLYWKPARKEP
jgi:nitroreductase